MPIEMTYAMILPHANDKDGPRNDDTTQDVRGPKGRDLLPNSEIAGAKRMPA
jgi:hypothetical protein